MIQSGPSSPSPYEFDYSKGFQELVVRLHRGKETLPNYHNYLRDHLGGPNSRVVLFAEQLCAEIEFHCGNLKTKRILDFGCGTGSSTVALAERGGEVCGFDVDDESITICRQRMREHGLDNRVGIYCASDFDDVKKLMGTFDLILLNGVIEHIPLTKSGLRSRTVKSLFSLLNKPGYLFINDTPNRLCPFDFHTTQLWWIPWTRPGSQWAFRRAVAKGRHSNAPTIDEGPLGLEEVGAWGTTYWEITGYLRGEPFVCLNAQPGHNRHIHYSFRGSLKRTVFEALTYYTVVKLLGIPITALAPSLTTLVIKRQ